MPIALPPLADDLLFGLRHRLRAGNKRLDWLRYRVPVRKVGHAGTLDPMATGLLLCLVGRSTKAQRHFMELEKEYGIDPVPFTRKMHERYRGYIPEAKK